MSGEITLTIENGPLLGNEYVFKEKQLCIIGRGEDCNIRLPGTADADISRHHCVLAIDPPRLSVSDLSSRHGTRVNGVLIGRRGDRAVAGDEGAAPDVQAAFPGCFHLCDGDALEVGKTVFRVRVVAASDGPPALVGPEARMARKPPASCGKLALEAQTAADLLTRQVVSVPASATVIEAEALLRDRGLSAVPVVGENGEPVGVFSRADVISFDCEENGYPTPLPAAAPGAGTPPPAGGSCVLCIEDVGPPRVRDIMTRVVFSVGPDTPASRVVDAMLSLRVHRLYVTDPAGNLVGVVSMTDVLRHLHQAEDRGA
jgi:CBS domain-containing protein